MNWAVTATSCAQGAGSTTHWLCYAAQLSPLPATSCAQDAGSQTHWQYSCLELELTSGCAISYNPDNQVISTPWEMVRLC
jgi:hypothetical protein